MNKPVDEAQLPLYFRHYSGPTIETMEDHNRLNAQLGRVKDLMRDGVWRTLEEISEVTHDPMPSISARLRDLRKFGFGSHTVNRKRRGPSRGLFEYQLVLNPETDPSAVQLIPRGLIKPDLWNDPFGATALRQAGGRA